MNDAHLHLILNHLPLTFTLLGLIVLVNGFLFKNEMVKRVAYSVFILAALVGFVALNTGEGAKDLIEGIKGIDKRIITVHEETALAFLVFLYILGILSLVGLWISWQKKSLSKIIGFITIGYLFVIFYYAFQAGVTGAEIRHSEIKKINVK